MKKIVFPNYCSSFYCRFSIYTSRFSKLRAIADRYSIKFDAGDPSGEFSGLKGTIAFDPAD